MINFKKFKFGKKIKFELTNYDKCEYREIPNFTNLEKKYY